MSSDTTLSVQAMNLNDGTFGSLLLGQDTRFGGAGAAKPPEAMIEVKELQIHIGNRPICRDLRALYKKTHKTVPPGLAIFSRYDVWIIPHVIGAIKRTGGGGIHALGYQADFDGDEVYTIDLVPGTKFDTKFEVNTALEVDLGLEGHAEVPQAARTFLDEFESFGGDARLKLSAEAKLVGRLSLSLIAPVVQTVGLYHSRCEWRFEVEKNPLLGDQLMFQTVLVPAGTTSIKMRARSYALIRSGLHFFPAIYWTEPLELELSL